MNENQLALVEDIPMDNPDALKKKKLGPENCLQEILIELLNERKCSLAEVQKATNIPWGTLMGWYNGDVGCQKLDNNVLALSKFFNVSIHYLAFGIGEDDPVFKAEA